MVCCQGLEFDLVSSFPIFPPSPFSVSLPALLAFLSLLYLPIWDHSPTVVVLLNLLSYTACMPSMPYYCQTPCVVLCAFFSLCIIPSPCVFGRTTLPHTATHTTAYIKERRDPGSRGPGSGMSGWLHVSDHLTRHLLASPFPTSCCPLLHARTALPLPTHLPHLYTAFPPHIPLSSLTHSSLTRATWNRKPGNLASWPTWNG